MNSSKLILNLFWAGNGGVEGKFAAVLFYKTARIRQIKFTENSLEFNLITSIP